MAKSHVGVANNTETGQLSLSCVIICFSFLMESVSLRNHPSVSSNLSAGFGAVDCTVSLPAPHARSSYMGYARSNVNAPLPLARLLAWRHRGSFLVLWKDVQAIDPSGITLRSGFTKYRPDLPGTHPD